MTDLVAAPGADTAQTTIITGTLPPNDGDRPLAWAPYEPAPKKRRTGLWVGLGVGALLIAAGAASMVLIAPGTTIAGIPVGGLTPGAAADAVSSRLADVEIAFTDASGDPSVTGADLGASVDAVALANEAFAEHPMWNLGAWMPEPIAADITLDTEVAHDKLRSLLPTTYEDAVDAGVVFDAASKSYVTTPAESGTGVDLDALIGSIAATITGGGDVVTYSGAPAEAPAAVSDAEATTVADQLNTMLGSLGFYVGEERTVPVGPAVAATWLEVVDDDGELRITADETAIQETVDKLPGLVNREPVDAEVVVNSGGDVLSEVTAGVNGRELGDVSQAASEFAEQLQNGDAAYALEVTEPEFATTTLHRYIDLNLSNQRAVLYQNGNVVHSWAISSGLPATPTPTGNFTVFAHTRIQDMVGRDYVTEDVPFNTWFAPDIAFHGAYWHNNFGTQMSHGCVNMPVWQAEYVYNWAPVGTEVSVHW
ncbi:L,D-transpeptidase family protein [Microbacterium abyssi]|uniref:L,D-transpeptidase family protein n=1 Tax=Microbacterium abyssi TaxID=2782166 RepID=UPI001E625E9B|nr:L,D-transpeptidase family protein [Microbacterium sp. A18JL241]